MQTRSAWSEESPLFRVLRVGFTLPPHRSLSLSFPIRLIFVYTIYVFLFFSSSQFFKFELNSTRRVKKSQNHHRTTTIIIASSSSSFERETYNRVDKDDDDTDDDDDDEEDEDK